MSYVRWSSPIPLNTDCPTCKRPAKGFGKKGSDEFWAIHEFQMKWARGPWFWRLVNRLAWFGAGGSLKPGTFRQRIRFWAQKHLRGLCKDCTSAWYVYHDCASGAVRENQVLAVWAAGCESLPLLPYPEIKRILGEQDFDAIDGFSSWGDQGVLRSSLEEFVSDVEEKFPEEPT